MGILRTIECEVCGLKYTEPSEGAGFPAWGQIQGFLATVTLCPDHLVKVGEIITDLKEGVNNGIHSQ